MIRELLSTCLLSVIASADVILELPYGKIKGLQTATTTNRTFYAFRKIPFAAPPVGELRFKPPVPPDPWDDILDATDNDVICYQTSWNSVKESEDCLYLNVYTPKLPTQDKELLPVMLYIYGGGFIVGDCLMEHCGPEYLIDNGVVVVTITYRVGPFGFLSTQDLTIPGNNGLKDQQMAIKWTNYNIELFGGDPHKITIFGQSAGSASVTYQLLNQRNKGLFRGTICQSGSFLSPWAFQRRSREIAFKTARLIDPTFTETNNTETLLQFLQNASAEEIDSASSMLEISLNDHLFELSQGFVYAPVIEPAHDKAFITENMYEALKKGNIIKVPSLVGITSEECLGFVGDIKTFRHKMSHYDANPALLVPDDMRIQALNYRALVGTKIKDMYVGNESWQGDLGSSVRYFSDNSFTRSVIKYAELYSKLTNVYFYQFSYDGKLGGFDTTISGAEKVSHAEDLNYIFLRRGYNSDLSTFPQSDVITQSRIQKIWTDFAKTLNPTPEPSDLLGNLTWPVVTAETFSYVDIDAELSIENYPKEKVYVEWNKLYTSLGYDDFDTY